MVPSRLFLYLAQESYVKAWVWGGIVPLYPASTYRSAERMGTKTPDENRIHDSAVDLLSHPLVSIDPDASVRGITIVGGRVDGQPVPDVVGGSYYFEDGLVLCLSTKRSALIAERLEKVACVRILELGKLKATLDQQIGCRSTMSLCRYTSDHRRNHFLKSEHDAWQREFRFFWPRARATSVRIPAGLAKRVSLVDVA